MLLELIKKSYRIYQPYFGFGAKNNARYHTFLSLLIFTGNVSLAFFMSLINAAFDSLMASIVPGISYRAFFASTGYFLLVGLAYAGVESVNNWLAYKLSSSLSHHYNQHIITRWLNSNAYFGTKFMRMAHKKNNSLSPAQIISNDSIQVTENISYLANNFLMTTSNFIIGLMGLILLSGPLVFPFMGFSIYIPDYLAIATVVYAIGFNVISGWSGDKLRAQQTSAKKATDRLYNHLHHLKTYAESIAFLHGAKNELTNLMKIMKQHRLTEIALGNIKSMLAFLNSLHQQMSGIFGVIISAPNVIEGHMDTTGVFQVAHHFSDVVRWFTWRNENLDKVSETLVGLERLEAFENKLNEWEKLQADPTHNQIKLTPVPHTQPLLFSQVKINTPEKDNLIGPLTLNFPKGGITLLQGPSGIGKSTLFRAIAGLWPFGRGQIHLPNNQANLPATILFIPQKPYFPYQKTLLDAIIYPNNSSISSPSPQELKNIRSWMKQLGFKAKTIQDLNTTVQEWEKTLSGGEQQRIAIVSALHKKPDFLFMDEGTSAIDNKNKKIVENLLKTRLPDTTIVYIDHNPSPDFHEHIIDLKTKKPIVSAMEPTNLNHSTSMMTRSQTQKINSAI